MADRNDYLPEGIQIGQFSVPVRYEDLTKLDKLGYWDSRVPEIVIHSEQSHGQKHIVIIHEILHLIEDFLIGNKIRKKRLGEETITQMAPLLLAHLVGAGLYPSVSTEQLNELMSFHSEDEDT